MYAFSAHMYEVKSDLTVDPVIYEHLDLNVGNAFNISSGKVESQGMLALLCS